MICKRSITLNKLTADLILRIPNETRPFKLQTDASDIGIQAVLKRTYPNGDLPVTYFSQKLSSTQAKWSTTEKECYAILAAIETWHKYLDGPEFVLETDHKPLVQLNVKAQINAKCERWTNLHTSVDGTLDSSEDVQVQSTRIPVDGSDEQVRQAVSNNRE
ncbi:unnamed protein product [Didymodactylos carnosus]|nr:unnamed protein product [Didymodactylos carnosus]